MVDPIRHADDHVRGYQPYQERVRPVIVFAIALSLVTALVLFGMRYTFDAFERSTHAGEAPRHPLAPGRELPPEPRLQALPALDLSRLRTREEERLSSYGWIDRDAGTVHVPIERAMELVLREGLPVRGGTPR